MNNQRAEKCGGTASRAGDDGLGRVCSLANGAVAEEQDRSIVISTGARWRNVNVPGEAAVQEQGRGLLPALRRPAVQGQEASR